VGFSLFFVINIEGNANSLKVPKNQIMFITKELINNSLFHAYSEIKTYKITLNFIITKENLIISVKDYGIGINKENLNKIFDPFFTTTRQRGSIGLGLFIVYNISKNILKGKIDLKSNSTGTVFKITLPKSMILMN
jgi:signal transduction histidine kinase